MTTDSVRRERRVEAGKHAYLARFGKDASVSSYLDHPRLPDMLMEAVESGEPLTAEALAKWLGGPRPGRWSWTMTDPTGQPETPLEQARRYVAEGEARVARQAEVLARAEAESASVQTVNLAWITLETMRRLLTDMREHLQIEEERAGPERKVEDAP
jgi:hypothetical protein